MPKKCLEKHSISCGNRKTKSKVVYCFRKKAPLQMFHWVVNTPKSRQCQLIHKWHCQICTRRVNKRLVVAVKNNPISANPTKWSNTLKQLVGNLPTNYFSVFHHFGGLALKGITIRTSMCSLRKLCCISEKYSFGMLHVIQNKEEINQTPFGSRYSMMSFLCLYW